jgi:hypothetical protein
MRPSGQAVAAASNLERKLHNRSINPGAQSFIERSSNADQKAAPDHVKDALSNEEHADNDPESNESGHASTRQNPIIDFQHKKRAGEHQNVAQATE